jgi:predicted phage terminase large subunit-like protein
MQRLHQGDLAGRLLEKGGWHYLKLPAIAQEDEKVPVGPHQFYQRRAGHALFPARQSLQYLRKKQAENPIVFAAQNLQDPVPLTGNWVDPEWFLYYDELPRGGKVVMSMDTASKPGATNDYTVAIVARFFNGRFYLIDVHRERMEFARLWGIVPQLCRRYGVQELLIEDASSGEMLIQRLRHEPPQGVPLPLAITPRGDKATRFEAEVSRIRAGEVLLPRNAIWVPEFIKEIAAFPNGRYDDQADALAQLLNNTWRAKKRRPNVGPILVHEGMTDDEFRRAVRAQDDASFLREAPSPRYPDDDDPWLPPFR